jgi:hypothetical protein
VPLNLASPGVSHQSCQLSWNENLRGVITDLEKLNRH